jgi:hypothetical protein
VLQVVTAATLKRNDFARQQGRREAVDMAKLLKWVCCAAEVVIYMWTFRAIPHRSLNTATSVWK